MSQPVVSQFSESAQQAINQYATGKKHQQASYTSSAILQAKKEAITAYAYGKRDAIKQWAGDTKTAKITVYGRAKDTKNEVVRAYGSKMKTEIVEKSDTEIIAVSILTGKTTEQKVESLVRQLHRKHPTETHESIIMRAYAVIWANAKPLLYYTTASVVVAVGGALIYTLLGAGSWMIFLTILKNLGLKVVPAILLRALRNAGVSLGTDVSLNALMGLAERNKTVAKILATQMKPQILVNSLKRMGIDLKDYDLTIKGLTRQAISSGITIGTTDIGSYLVSSGLSASTKVVGVGLAKAKKGLKDAIKNLETIPGQVVDEVMTELPKKAIDTLQITKAIEAKTLTKNKPKIAREAPAAQAPEASGIREMMNENKAMAFGGTAAIALVTIALASTDVSSITAMLSERLTSIGAALPDVSNITDKGFDFIRENAAARQTLFGLISSKIGLQRVIDVFVDKLTPNQIARLKILDQKIKTSSLQQRPTHIQSFFALLMGEKIYDLRELRGMNDQQLKAAAKIKNIKFDKDVSHQALIDAIIRDQVNRLNNLTQMVAGLVTSTVKTTLSAAALEYAYQNLPYASAPIATLEDELKTAEKEADRTITALDEPITESIEAKVQRESLAAGLKERELAEIHTREDAEVLRLARREQAKLTASLGRAQLEQAQLDQAKITKEVATHRDALRRLRASALETDLAKKMVVTIVGPDGVAHPIPADELLLDVRLQKAMEGVEFTPLMQYLGKQVAKSSISWVPGLGYVESVLNTANWSLDMAEKLKDVYKVVNVAVQITNEKGESLIDIGQQGIDVLDRLLRQRLPTLSDAVDDLLTLEKVNLKKVTLETLRDKILYGWDNSRVSYEIGKKIVVGKEAGDFAESTIKQIGEMVWSKVFNVGS